MIIKSAQIQNGTEEYILPSNASLLKVEAVDGTTQVQVKFESGSNYQTIGGIKAYDFSKVTNINTPGIYSYDINGCYSVQLIYSGSTSIQYKILN